MFQRNVVSSLRYISSPPVCLCGMYRNICTFYFYWRRVRTATKTYVKKSFTISPIRPKWCRDWPCTSHIALRRQALPSIPKLVSKSSTTIYRSALWKQKNTGNHSSKQINLHYCCCILYFGMLCCSFCRGSLSSKLFHIHQMILCIVPRLAIWKWSST